MKKYKVTKLDHPHLFDIVDSIINVVVVDDNTKVMSDENIDDLELTLRKSINDTFNTINYDTTLSAKDVFKLRSDYFKFTHALKDLEVILYLGY